MAPILVLFLVVVAATWIVRHVWSTRRERELLDRIPTYTSKTHCSTIDLYRQGYEVYSKNGRFFKVDWGGGRYTIMVPRNRLPDIKNVPEKTMSYNVAFWEDGLLGRYTGAPARHSGTDRPLRIELRRSARQMTRTMVTEVNSVLDELLAGSNDWQSVKIQEVISHCVPYVMNRLICGETFAKNKEWVTATLHYTEDLHAAAEVIRSAVPWVQHVKALMSKKVRKIRAFKLLTRSLLAQALQQSRAANGTSSDKTEKPELLPHFLSMAGHQISFNEMADSILRIVLASIRTTVWMTTQTVADLLYRPEHIPGLYAEVEAAISTAYDSADAFDVEKMLQLDAFVMESMRFSTLPIISITRKTAEDFAFADGTVIPPGYKTYVPVEAIYHDELIFPMAENFDPSRFNQLRQSRPEELKAWRAASPSEAWFSFGYGAQACPGRWMASAAMRIILAKLLLDYDMEYDEEGSRGPPTVKYESFQGSPKRQGELVMRIRRKAKHERRFPSV